MPPSAICCLQRLEREPAALGAERACPSPAPGGRARSAAPWPRRRAPGTRRPAAAGPSRPSTSTGVDGGAAFVGRPRSSMSARTLPTIGPAMNVSPTRSVPSCTRMVATGPRPRSSFASSTVPDALRFGFALSSPMSVTSRIISSSRSRFCFFLAETSTMTVVPPQSSGTRPSSASSRLTWSGLAPGLSILLIATMIGTFAAFAWSIASLVCGITPSSAATTSTTTSVTLAPRARIIVNASWPGVSRKTTLRPSDSATW